MQDEDKRILGPTQARRRLHDSVEDRLELRWRAADDVQHVACGRLVLERLLQLPRARLHLLEQPHVLDRDHRLVGERGDEFDLLFVEGVTVRRAIVKTPTATPSRSIGTPKQREAPRILQSRAVVFVIGKHIWHVDRATLGNRSADNACRGQGCRAGVANARHAAS